MAGKIYTRKGDLGETRLFSGEKVSKDDLRLETYGTLDELQAQLGMSRALVREKSLQAMILDIQKDISAACSELASNPEVRIKLKRHIGQSEAQRLERQIDELTSAYGLPGGFIYPGRSVDSAALHIARTICRRAERLLVALNRQVPEFSELIVYFNRLSDLLFVIGWSLEVRSAVESAVQEVVKGELA